MPRPDPLLFTFAVLLAGSDYGGEVLLLRSEGHVDRLAEGGLPADAAELLPDKDTVIISVRLVRIVRIHSQASQDSQDSQNEYKDSHHESQNSQDNKNIQQGGQNS